MSNISRVFIGVDLGDKRIGLSKSDPLGLIASPVKTIPAVNINTDIQNVVEFATECSAQKIIIGLPLLMSGEKGFQANKASDFAKLLSDNTPIPVQAEDERLSSVEAENILNFNCFLLYSILLDRRTHNLTNGLFVRLDGKEN